MIWPTSRLILFSSRLRSNPCSRAPSTWCCALAGFTSKPLQAMWAQSWCRWGLLPWLLEAYLWNLMNFCRSCDSIGPTTQNYPKNLDILSTSVWYQNTSGWFCFGLGQGSGKNLSYAVAGNRCDLSWGMSILPVLKTFKDWQHNSDSSIIYY